MAAVLVGAVLLAYFPALEARQEYEPARRNLAILDDLQRKARPKD